MDTLHRDEVAVVPRKQRRLRRSLVEQRPEDEWGAGLIERLGVLEMWMGGP
jgi:hypothetical protein